MWKLSSHQIEKKDTSQYRLKRGLLALQIFIFPHFFGKWHENFKGRPCHKSDTSLLTIFLRKDNRMARHYPEFHHDSLVRSKPNLMDHIA